MHGELGACFGFGVLFQSMGAFYLSFPILRTR